MKAIPASVAAAAAFWTAPAYAGVGIMSRIGLSEALNIVLIVISSTIALVYFFDRSRSRRAEKMAREYAQISIKDIDGGTFDDPLEDEGDEGAQDTDLAQSPMRPLPRQLIEAAAQGNLVLVAGNSALIRDQAPSWREFLIHTADIARAELGPERWDVSQNQLQRLIDRGREDAAADLLERELGKERLADIARRIFAESKPSPTFFELCDNLAFSGIVSMSVDDIFAHQKSERDLNVLTAQASDDFETIAKDQRPFLIELAGNLKEPGTLAWTALQLKTAIADAPDLRAALAAILASRTALFIGMSASAIEDLWDSLEFFHTAPTPHFALIERDPDFEIISGRFASRYNIQLVNIDGRAAFAAVANEMIERMGISRQQTAIARNDHGMRRNAVITQLRLGNIGPVEYAEIDLSSSWTMLLGNNGVGKSTILRAIALVLAGTDPDASKFGRALLRTGAKSGLIELTIETPQRPVTYRCSLRREGDRVTISSGVSPVQSGTLIAFGFTAVRGISLPTSGETVRFVPDPLPRTDDVTPLLVGGIDTRANDLRDWLRSTYSIMLDRKLADAERQRAEEMITTVFEVIDDLIPGFELRFSHIDQRSQTIYLETTDGQIPIDYVSQGMSSMLGWIGTLVKRLYDIVDEREDPRLAHAIVLIDEIDSHLHPEWQQRLVPAIRRIFPNLQVIASTHSALMVGSLGDGEIIKVDRMRGGIEIERLERSFQGYRVDQILTDDAFDLASTRDPAWEAQREEYKVLLGKGKRTADEEARYRELDALMDGTTPPYESRADREIFAVARDRFEASLAETVATSKASDE